MRLTAFVSCVLVVGLPAARAQEFATRTAPFRVSLLSLHRQRDIMLVQGPWVWVDEDGHQRSVEKRTPRTRLSGGPLFQARLRVSTMPQTFFRLEGDANLAEAVDDLDQSLEAAPDDGQGPRPGTRQVRTSYSTIDVRLPLSLPEQPGKTIKRLRGTVTLVVPKRASEPIDVFPLSDAKGRSAAAGDAKIVVNSVKIDAEQRAVISLTARLENERGDFRDKAYQARVAMRLVDVAQHQIEVVDDQTRPIARYPTTAVKRNEVRITLRSTPSDQYGAPDRLRLFGVSLTAVDVPFDFKDVPMP